MSHMVHVVSIEEEANKAGFVSFQSKEVKGEQYSDFLFCWDEKKKKLKKKNEKK